MSMLRKIIALCTMVLFGGADEVQSFYRSITEGNPMTRSFADSRECQEAALDHLNRLNQKHPKLQIGDVSPNRAREIINHAFAAHNLCVRFLAPGFGAFEPIKGIVWFEKFGKIFRVYSLILIEDYQRGFIHMGDVIDSVYCNGARLDLMRNFGVHLETFERGHNFFENNPAFSFLAPLNLTDPTEPNFIEDLKRYLNLLSPNRMTDLFCMNRDRNPIPDLNGEQTGEFWDYWLKCARIGGQCWTIQDILNIHNLLSRIPGVELSDGAYCIDDGSPYLDLYHTIVRFGSILKQDYHFSRTIFLLLSIGFFRTPLGAEIIARIANQNNPGYLYAERIIIYDPYLRQVCSGIIAIGNPKSVSEEQAEFFHNMGWEYQS